MQLQLQLLLRAAEAGCVGKGRRAAQQAHTLAHDLAERVLADAALVLGLEADVNAAVVDLARAGAAAHRRVRIPHFGTRADHARDFLRLERRVVEAGAGRRLDGDVQLTLIAHRHEREAANDDL